MHIVLVSTDPDADRVGLIGWAQNHGVPDLVAIPVLGTNKIDYPTVEKMGRAAAQG